MHSVIDDDPPRVFSSHCLTLSAVLPFSLSSLKLTALWWALSPGIEPLSPHTHTTHTHSLHHDLTIVIYYITTTIYYYACEWKKKTKGAWVFFLNTWKNDSFFLIIKLSEPVRTLHSCKNKGLNIPQVCPSLASLKATVGYGTTSWVMRMEWN